MRGQTSPSTTESASSSSARKAGFWVNMAPDHERNREEPSLTCSSERTMIDVIFHIPTHGRVRQFPIKFQAQEKKLPKVDQYALRIPKMYFMKSQQIGHGRAVLASTADSAQFWQIGQNWPCYSAQPFHALFARISCNTFLESLKHTDQPWVGFVSGV